jgi:hypothetical protein
MPASEQDYNAAVERVIASAPANLSEADFDRLVDAELSKPARTWGDTLTDALPSIGGAVGGLVGNVPGALLGGAAGQGAKTLVQKAGEIPGALSDIAGNLTSQPGAMAGGFLRGAFGGANEAAGQAALQGVGQGAGNVVGAGLQLAGRGMYRAGALPLTQMFSKHGDLVKKGLDARVPVTKGGLLKAQGLKAAAQGAIAHGTDREERHERPCGRRNGCPTRWPPRPDDASGQTRGAIHRA